MDFHILVFYACEDMGRTGSDVKVPFCPIPNSLSLCVFFAFDRFSTFFDSHCSFSFPFPLYPDLCYSNNGINDKQEHMSPAKSM